MFDIKPTLPQLSSTRTLTNMSRSYSTDLTQSEKDPPQSYASGRRPSRVLSTDLYGNEAKDAHDAPNNNISNHNSNPSQQSQQYQPKHQMQQPPLSSDVKNSGNNSGTELEHAPYDFDNNLENNLEEVEIDTVPAHAATTSNFSHLSHFSNLPQDGDMPGIDDGSNASVIIHNAPNVASIANNAGNASNSVTSTNYVKHAKHASNTSNVPHNSNYNSNNSNYPNNPNIAQNVTNSNNTSNSNKPRPNGRNSGLSTDGHYAHVSLNSLNLVPLPPDVGAQPDDMIKKQSSAVSSLAPTPGHLLLKPSSSIKGDKAEIEEIEEKSERDDRDESISETGLADMLDELLSEDTKQEESAAATSTAPNTNNYSNGRKNSKTAAMGNYASNSSDPNKTANNSNNSTARSGSLRMKLVNNLSGSARNQSNTATNQKNSPKQGNNSNHRHTDTMDSKIGLDATERRPKLVIIDFGDAMEVELGKKYNDFCGTPAYIPPEIVRARFGYELKCGDMWAVGVIAFILVTGIPPFYGRNDKETIQKILKCKLVWPKHVQLSEPCKNFIAGLLKKNPSLRMTATKALKHEWIQSKASTQNLGAKLIENIADFHQASLVFLFLLVFVCVSFVSFA